MDNQEWMDSLSEEETLLLMLAAMYHYDVISHDNDRSFDADEWLSVFEPAEAYAEKCIGRMYADARMGEWYRAKASRVCREDEQNG